MPRASVVPFLTTKHSMDFCLGYADQVVQHGFPALVVLGGDKHVGRARARSNTRGSSASASANATPSLPLGGWANPAGDAGPAGGLRRRPGKFTADFYLTQIVSHHRAWRCRRRFWAKPAARA